MLFLGLATPGRVSAATSQAIKYTKLTPMVPQPVDTGGNVLTTNNGYTCNASNCRGVGLSDLLFHRLQDALNQANAALYLLIKITRDQAYSNPQLTVNGVIDVSTMKSAYLIGATGLVPGFPTGLSMADLAANAASLTTVLLNFVASQRGTGSGGVCDPTVDKNCPCDPTVNRNCVVDPVTGITTNTGGTRPGATTTGGGPTVYYVCPDGTKTPDPTTCTTPIPVSTTATTAYVCWDGSQVADPSVCAPYPQPSNGGYVSQPAPAPVTVTTTTASDGSTSVTTAPDVPRLFGFPRTWVIGGVASAGALAGILIAAFAIRRRR